MQWTQSIAVRSFLLSVFDANNLSINICMHLLLYELNMCAVNLISDGGNPIFGIFSLVLKMLFIFAEIDDI